MFKPFIVPVDFQNPRMYGPPDAVFLCPKTPFFVLFFVSEAEIGRREQACFNEVCGEHLQRSIKTHSDVLRVPPEQCGRTAGPPRILVVTAAHDA
jgi:hypothetical protein